MDQTSDSLKSTGERIDNLQRDLVKSQKILIQLQEDLINCNDVQFKTLKEVRTKVKTKFQSYKDNIVMNNNTPQVFYF